jgi:hypothetical protein
MNDWQKKFLQKLEHARKQWLGRFEEVARESLDPVVERLTAFLTNNGFDVTQSQCEPGTRIHRFALTENGYALFTLRLAGMDRVELRCEISVPGEGALKGVAIHVPLCDADESWFEDHLQDGLDRFITAFVEAGVDTDAKHKQLQPA